MGIGLTLADGGVGDVRIFLLWLMAFLIYIVLPIKCMAMPNDIEAEGVFYPEQGVSLNQMRRIAILDAYRYLAEQVDAIYVSSSSTVKNLRELDDTINTRVETSIRGAKIVSITRESDGSIHAKIRLPLSNGTSSIAAAVLPSTQLALDFPKPRSTHIEVPENYTGLVVNCKNIAIEYAIVPAVKAVDGREIYSYKNIGYQKTLEKGLVEYAIIADEGRVGNNPLIVNAVSASDGCDIVVSNEDADKILVANQMGKFLNSCAVCVVR